MAPKICVTYIDQTFLNERCPPFPLRVVPEIRLNASYLDWLDDKPERNASEIQSIGMHLAYAKSGSLAALAICLDQKVLLITDVVKSPRASLSATRRTLHSRFLSATSGFRVVAFNAHEVVLALHKDMTLTCARALDLLSLPPRKRDVVQMVNSLKGARLELFDSAIREAFDATVYDQKNSNSILAQQAWFAWYIGTLSEPQEDLARIPLIDSSSFTKIELDTLARNMEGLLLRDFAKSTEETIDVSAAPLVYQGNKVSWEQERYGGRLRNSRHQVVKANVHGQATLTGAVWDVQGKKAVVNIQHLDVFNEPKIQSLTVFGRALPTNAEQQHTLTILETLQQKTPLFDDHWMKRLFVSPSDVETFDTECVSKADGVVNGTSEFSQASVFGQEWDSAPPWNSDGIAAVQTSDALPEDSCDWAVVGEGLWATTGDGLVSHSYESPGHCQLVYGGNLNPSQAQAVQSMLDFDKDISVIEGPPGTGKTTVIAAYITEILSQPDKTCLVIAESNVAIKNVGEKLSDVGVTEWVLVVSSEFLVGWHEHLYKQISKTNLLASKDMRGPLHTRIVLCTLSMLSNSKFHHVTRHLHFESVIVEEASQISMNSYIPMIKWYGKYIKKMTFIGDDKQLPPFASEDTEALASIFENKGLLKHLRPILLNIQYRMPPAIGDFLSREVYSATLQSWDCHPIQSLYCAQFINVNGNEEPDKFSFKNSAEVSVALSIATRLHQRQASFKIITPYEPQRDLLEQKLKVSDLPWANTCFTVDSFQGNEGDYIIISTVRTKSVGFLHDIRRSNVMLSRAKKGMFICTNKSFLQSPSAKGTLIGKMAEEWTRIEKGWIEDIADLTVKLHIE